jgi:hypothetical protein
MATIDGIVRMAGLTGQNGARSSHGLSLQAGLFSDAGLSSTTGLMTTDEGRKTVTYLVRCALGPNDTLVKADNQGVQHAFVGQIGLCPQWLHGGIATNRSCQHMVSACMMAFVNRAGVQIPIWLDSAHPKIGWGVDPAFPLQEGTFFGNVMTTGLQPAIGLPTTMSPNGYFCAGHGISVSVVAGRLNASDINTPYMGYGVDGMCLNSESIVAGPTSPGKTDPDGFTRICAGAVCFENGEPITVWRNNFYLPGFDPTYRYFLSPMHVPVQLGSKALEVAGGSTFNGTPVQQNAGSGSIDSQQFAISRPGVATPWQIALKIATNKCIGPVGNGTGNATMIEVQDCNGGANQAWSISAAANSGGFTFINVASNRCLEVQPAFTDGALVYLSDCNGALNQTFKVAAAF